MGWTPKPAEPSSRRWRPWTMQPEQIIKALNQAGVGVRDWAEVCAYAAGHTLAFARAVAEAEREACADACIDAAALPVGASARSVASYCATAILGRSWSACANLSATA